MATILTKRSNTASSVPVAGDLTNSTGGAELAVNTADKRLFTKDSGGTVVELGTNPSTMAVAGNATVGGTLGVTGTATLAGASVTSLTNSGATTLSSGTANGVAYLNGSKVLTSGSALTFDGTNFTLQPASGAPYVYLKDVSNRTARLVGPTGVSDGEVGTSTNHDFVVNAGASGGSGINLKFTLNAVEQMRLTSTGLGIGTSSPGAKLGIVAAGDGTFNSQVIIAPVSGANPAKITFNPNVSSAIAGLSDGSVAFYGNGANTERARIDSSGNLLIGTTSSATNASAGIKNITSPTSPSVAVVSTNSTSGGNSYFSGYSTDAGAYRFYVTNAGVVNATSTTITAISDQRLKENVRYLDTGLNSIMALKPRRFDWKKGKGQDKKDVAGFIAQEFETVFPECVGTTLAGDDGVEYKNINHETLIPTLVKAIQEQQAIITSLTARIEALEAK